MSAPGIVFIANPANPTGTWITAEEVRRLHAGLPPSVLLVLDGAYAEFSTDPRVRRRAGPGARIASTSSSPTPSPRSTAWRRLRVGWAYAPVEIVRGDRPHPPAVQHLDRRPGGRDRGPGRHGLPGPLAGAGRALAAVAGAAAGRPGPGGHALGGQLRPGPLPDRRRAGPPPTPRPSWPRMAIWCAASPATACPSTCASPSAWKSTTAPWSTCWPSSSAGARADERRAGQAAGGDRLRPDRLVGDRARPGPRARRTRS